MRDKLFIAIGVSNAKGLPRLPGVWQSVDDMTSWAKDADYEVVAVTDRDNRVVDVARVREEILKALRPGLSRIILYFAGHGFSVRPDQYLILSAGPSVPDQRIVRDGLRDMLATWGAPQISVITDACMVTAPFKGLAVSVLDPNDGEVPKQYFDGFYATEPGAKAFAFRATDDTPELCLFSSVLHRGLTFKDEGACDRHEGRPGRKVVTSYSLGDYLDAVVPQEAALRSVWQQPQTNTGFRPPRHVYSERLEADLFTGIGGGKGRIAGDSPDDPPDGSDPMLEVEVPDDAMFKSTHAKKPISPAGAGPQTQRPARRPNRPLEDRVRSEWRRPFTQWAFDAAIANEANVVIDGLDGAKPKLKTKAGGVTLTRISPYRDQQHRNAFTADTREGLDWEHPSDTALIISGTLTALLPLYRDLWSVVQIEKGRGPIAVAWGSIYMGPAPGEISALEVLKGMLRGRLSAADITDLAATMRYEKHRDPIKGMVSAYLYDSVGDIENIRRMCWYYYQRGQDVPFDIALLSRLPFEVSEGRTELVVPPTPIGTDQRGPSFTYEATPDCRPGVAGRAPFFRAGWSKLQSLGEHGQMLMRIADDLTDNPIATFRGKAARKALTTLISA